MSYIQKCRESSSDAGGDRSAQQSVNDVMLTARLKEVDLSCQLNECKEKLLITEQQVQTFAFLCSGCNGLVVTCLTAALREVVGLNLNVGSCVYRDIHCDIQP